MSEQLTFPEPVARATDPGTSWAAAKSVRNQSEAHRRIVSLLVEHGPMSDQEIYRRLKQQEFKISESGARTRRKELVDGGKVADTGLTFVTESGRKTKVWEAM